MSIGQVIYKLDPTLSPVRPKWSLPPAIFHRRRVGVDNVKGR